MDIRDMLAIVVEFDKKMVDREHNDYANTLISE